MKIGKFRNSGWLILLKLWAAVILIVLGKYLLLKNYIFVICFKGVLGIIYEISNLNTLNDLKDEYKLV